jgi:hypothetical protein
MRLALHRGFLLGAALPAMDKLESTHSIALQAMALEELDRVKDQTRIAQCAKFLVDNQHQTGYWSLGSPSIDVEDLQVDWPGKEHPGGPAPEPRSWGPTAGMPRE